MPGFHHPLRSSRYVNSVKNYVSAVRN